MSKNETIKYVAKKISKLASSGRHAPIDCEMLATEIYTYIMNSEKIQKMATGKCDHEFELLEDDGFYPNFEKVKCVKCNKIKMRKIK